MPAVAQDGFLPRLLQAQLASSAVPAGGSLAVTWWWTNAGTVPAAADLRVFVHVRRPGEAEDAPAAVRLGGDHDPAVPTHRWRPGRVLTWYAPVPIPADTPPGDYLLLVGLYGPDGRRALELPVAPGDGGHRYLVARFTVRPAGQAANGQPLTQTFFPGPAPTEAVASAPAETVNVGDGPLTVVLDAAAPRAVAWRMDGAELGGDPEGELPDVTVLSTADNHVSAADLAPYAIVWKLDHDVRSAVYQAAVSRDGQPCLRFDLTFRLHQREADVALENVVEQPGHQLVAVRPNRLVSAGRGAKLALPHRAGRLVEPGAGPPAEQAFALDWFNALLAGIVYDEQLLCTASMDGVDDRLVAGTGAGWAAVGASFEHRSPAGQGVPSLLLSDRAAIRLRFVRPEGRSPDWTDGARLLRADLTAVPPAIYDHTMIYKIFCDSPGAKSYTTFAQAVDLLRRVGHLIDHAPQLVYLVGWQHQGHDTGYPDVFTVNERLGGEDGLRTAIRQAGELNAVMSVHDNYDDAYEASPAWDPELIARDPAGNLMKGGVWAGGQSFIFSFRKYGLGSAQRRVNRTLDQFPMRVSYHLDVLSAVPRRRDYNPASPTSGADSIVGKRAIVEAFNRRGVDVTSEGLTAPFVGLVGHSWHLQRGREVLFPGEQRIPFVPFVYHGHATYGGAKPTTLDIPDALLYGATFSADFNRGTTDLQLTDSYYLLTVPYLQLRRRELSGYRAAGTIRRTEFGPDSYVEVDDAGPRYLVVVDGRPVVRDDTSFAPNAQGDAWLAYSRHDGTIDYPAPAGWTAAEGVALTANGPGEAVTVGIDGGRLRIEMKAGVPVKVVVG